MAQVKIGREFFQKIKLDYSDWRWALVREFAQNCFDAPGAKRVSISVSPISGGGTLLEVSNDGAPMDEATLVGKLLTLGGSGKNFDGEATGGFGVAKSLLYYTHVSYTIRTGSLMVTGSGAQYEITAAPAVAGTVSTVILEGDHVQAITDRVRRFAALAQWRGELTLNGEIIPTDMRKGARRRDMGWGVVYTNNSHSNLCVVRLNGQPMFTSYTRFKGCVLVELTGKAKDVLTSNRDGLTGAYASELTDLLASIAVDKKSALREQRAEYRRYAGERLKNEAKQPKAAALSLGDILRSEEPAADGDLTGRPAAPVIPGLAGAAPTQGGGIKLVIASREDEPDRTVSVGPEFILKNTTGRKVPAWYTPGNKFSAYCRDLIGAWTRVLLKLHELRDHAAEFSVGFVFDEESEAEHETGVYGRVYYINPAKFSEGGNRFEPRYESLSKSRHWIIAAACHEFVHGLGYKEHDEDYAGALTEVMSTALESADDLAAIFKRTAPQTPREPSDRQLLLGYAPTSIVRWMGAQGWSATEASRTLAAFGVNIADATTRIQLRAGRNGERGEVPCLTRKQAAELNTKRDASL